MGEKECTDSPVADEKKKEDVKVARRIGTGFRGRRLTVEANPRVIADLIADATDVEHPKTAGPVLSKRHPAQELQTPGAVVSVWGTQTEDKDMFVPFFAQKGINFDGQLSRMKHRLGVLSHRGHKPDQPNQDEFFVLARADSVLLGVLDGHGPDGHDVSHFAQEHLPTNIMEGMRQDPESWETSVNSAVERLCEQSAEDSDIHKKAEISGCTMSVLMLDSPSSDKIRLRSAFLGDSIAVLAKRKCKGDSWEITQLTQIHRPDREDEARRIAQSGGTVIPGEGGDGARLAAGGWSLAISRSFGDFSSCRYGLSHEPEFFETELESGFEYFILVCSDGVWDVMTLPQVVNLVGKFGAAEAQTAVEKLVSKAQLKWQEQGDLVDDITAVLLWPAFGAGLESVCEDAEEKEQTEAAAVEASEAAEAS